LGGVVAKNARQGTRDKRRSAYWKATVPVADLFYVHFGRRSRWLGEARLAQMGCGTGEILRLTLGEKRCLALVSTWVIYAALPYQRAPELRMGHTATSIARLIP
jgi:hypothetical protein